MSQKNPITILTICSIVCLSFLLLNNNDRINTSNNDILTAKQAEAATVFSNIEVTARKDTSATIQYNTDIAATGQIEYGLTTSYGNLTTEQGLSYWQSIEITNLTEGTTYHYRIITKDIDDNETISNDYTFTTRTQAELEALVRAARTNNDLPKTYYVKTDGDDARDGLSIDNAWQSPTTAASRAEAGDVIYLLDGIWYDEHVVFENSGIDTHMIVLKAYSGMPTLDGVDKTTGNGIEMSMGSSFINIIGNLVIKNYGGIGNKSGVYINGGSSHIKITDLTITSLDGWGIYTRPDTHYITIDNNEITHTGSGGAIITHLAGHFEYNISHITIINNIFDDNNHDAINIFGNNKNVLIENNSISHATNGAGIMVHNSGNRNITIRNNTIVDSTRGIWLIGLDGCLVEGNTILNSYAHYGIFIYTLTYSLEKPTVVQNVLIRNNIIKNSSLYDIFFYPSTGEEISNILFVNNSLTELIRFHGNNISNITIRNIPDATREISINDSVTNLQVEFTDNRTFKLNGDAGGHISKTLSEPGTYTIEVEEPSDTLPPNTSSHSPAKDSTNISKDTNITLHIQDNDSGVDQSTIQMTVEGETVSPTITGTTSDYTLTYNPPSDFDYNQVVDVTIDASDLASTPNAMDTETYSFTVQSSPDSAPPTGSIQINSGDSQTNSQTANLTISATDESDVTQMKTSETNDFSSATAETYSTIKSFILSIGDGIKTIYIWFKDTIGNWNNEPYSDSIELDSTGPTISNIQSNETTNSSTITFQTNELSTSCIEYGLTSIYGNQTDSNLNPLSTFNFQLSDLSSNTTYHYRIISEDELTNSSNSTDQTFKTNQSVIPDTTSPQAINDLSSSNITQTSADLSWTSPGDDNNEGTASAYDIRYSRQNLSDLGGQSAWWSQAIEISGEPIPQSSGTEQSIYIAVGLSPNTKYYFAIKTSDEVPNVSDISNILSFTTLEESVSPPGGGGGGGGTISDTTPPSKPSNFKATGADAQIVLTWNNPADSDFVRVKLLRKENSSPSSHNDSSAEIVYEGTNQEYTDIELDNNTTYYYSIFAYDKKPNYSEALSISSKPIEGKTSISNGNGKQTYPEGTLIKIPESFKIYIIINQKKKWIPTPEVFETLGYEWTSITEINKTELSNIPNYEDNLIRAIQDYKVYLVVSGIKRHIPNPEIFLNYGFEWDDVKDVNQETINQYSQNLLIKESKQQKVYYLCPERKIRRWLRSPDIFNSYNNSWEDIQVISKYEMEHYRESNLIKLIGDNKIYLIENNTKRLIKSSEEFERLGLDWGMVMEVGEVEIGW